MNVEVNIWDADNPQILISTWHVPIVPELNDILLVSGRQMRVSWMCRNLTLEDRKVAGVIGETNVLIVDVKVYLIPAKEQAKD